MGIAFQEHDRVLMQAEAYQRSEVPQRVTEFTEGRAITYWRFVDQEKI